MRLLLALGGALVLAGCATSKERVTLLDPSLTPGSQNSKMGSVVVFHEEGEPTEITMADQQAQMRGTRKPRIRQLAGRSDVHTDVLAGLPLPIAAESFSFAIGAEELSPAKLKDLQEFLQGYILSYCVYYRKVTVEQCQNPSELPPPTNELPPFRVVIEGFTDSSGSDTTPDNVLEDVNNRISQARADSVKRQVVALVQKAGIPIQSEQISANGNGQYAALIKHSNQRVADESFRIVSVTVR